MPKHGPLRARRAKHRPKAVPAPEQRSKQPATWTVEPGDNLWTIAQERLGPDAPTDLIAVETGRILSLTGSGLGRIRPGSCRVKSSC